MPAESPSKPGDARRCRLDSWTRREALATVLEVTRLMLAVVVVMASLSACGGSVRQAGSRQRTLHTTLDGRRLELATVYQLDSGYRNQLRWGDADLGRTQSPTLGKAILDARSLYAEKFSDRSFGLLLLAGSDDNALPSKRWFVYTADRRGQYKPYAWLDLTVPHTNKEARRQAVAQGWDVEALELVFGRDDDLAVETGSYGHLTARWKQLSPELRQRALDQAFGDAERLEPRSPSNSSGAAATELLLGHWDELAADRRERLVDVIIRSDQLRLLASKWKALSPPPSSPSRSRVIEQALSRRDWLVLVQIMSTEELQRALSPAP